MKKKKGYIAERHEMRGRNIEAGKIIFLFWRISYTI